MFIIYKIWKDDNNNRRLKSRKEENLTMFIIYKIWKDDNNNRRLKSGKMKILPCLLFIKSGKMKIIIDG